MESFKDRGKSEHSSWSRFCTADCCALVSTYQLSHIVPGVGFKLPTSKVGGRCATHYTTYHPGDIE